MKQNGSAEVTASLVTLEHATLPANLPPRFLQGHLKSASETLTLKSSIPQTLFCNPLNSSNSSTLNPKPYLPSSPQASSRPPQKRVRNPKSLTLPANLPQRFLRDHLKVGEWKTLNHQGHTGCKPVVQQYSRTGYEFKFVVMLLFPFLQKTLIVIVQKP